MTEEKEEEHLYNSKLLDWRLQGSNGLTTYIPYRRVRYDKVVVKLSGTTR